MTRASWRPMWKIHVLLLTLLLSGCAASWHDDAGAAPDGTTLDAWLASDLQPYLSETLTRHPRFKGEPLLVVSMDGDRRRLPEDELSATLVRSMTDALLRTSGVNLVREQGAEKSGCAPHAKAHYYVGVDIVAVSGGAHRVSVRALDIEDNSWVSGFGRQWQGRLKRAERSAFEQRQRSEPDPGTRDNPFAEGQADLLAKQLAGALARQYCGRAGAPLRIMPVADGDAPPVVARTVTLVGNYLAGSDHVDIVDGQQRANARLTGKLVPIDRGLHQLWLQLRPVGSGDDLRATDLQAYVRLTANRGTPITQRDLPVANPQPARAAPPPSGAALLSAVRVVTPIDRQRCRGADPWRRGARTANGTSLVSIDACFALEIESRRDAHVFLLARDRNARLVRLLPNSCDRYGRVSSFVKRGGKLRFPSRNDGQRHAFSADAAQDFDVFYVVAVANRASARLVLGHVLDTADVCQRRGSSRTAAHGLTALENLVNGLGPEGGWQRVEIVPARPST